MGFRRIIEPFVTQLTSLTATDREWIEKVDSRICQVEEWREIGDTNEPAFENSWANTGGAYETAAFYIDPHKRVHLKGRVDTGTGGTTAFTLPAGYRPAGTIVVDGVTITAGGAVQPATNPDYLDTVSFRAEQ